MSITGKDKDMSIRNLLKSELEFGKSHTILRTNQINISWSKGSQEKRLTI
jgi:hypothetical protein